MRDTQLSDPAANSAANVVTALVDGGYLRIYSGAQPASANDPAIGTLLVELPFSSPAYQSAVGGIAASNTISAAVALATGTAGWYRVVKSDGTTVVFDGSVGTSDANLLLNSVAIQVGITVSISGLNYNSNGP